MVIIDASEGEVVDIWFRPGSSHEKKSLKTRFFRSPYLRSFLRGFDGLKLPGVEVMTVGRGKGKASQRQYVETVLSVVGKAMYFPWKKGITAQAYIHAKAIAFNRKAKLLALQQAI